ncbi:hypothetical protein K503DRAFT_714771 [Rhizopogon vinicolor AM-OR11-026]|uniref:histidine kinase n=1 Tax=Rhizopogon vinicolor AM-OR11-026 TaxID=1314800 RepID=A0A1B7N691_9AGAM|nr:hypothetical protein K503DRAFT_714771 [Rhizopogon vinicolor AM-OR11-026]
MPRIHGLRLYWAHLLKRMDTESPSTSAIVDSSLDSSQIRPRTDDDPDADEVDEIVVDRDWTEDMKSSVNHSELPQEKSGDSHIVHVGSVTDTSVSHGILEDPGLFRQFLIFLRWEVWPVAYKFFYVQFYDENTEKRYRKERWFIRKSLALWSVMFFIANWVIGVSTIADPVTIIDKSWLWGFVPAHTIPLVFMIVYDFPRDRQIPYQLLLTISTWSWSLYEVVTMYVCGYYRLEVNTCGTKDFLGTFYYTSALQTIALFGMKMNRVAAMIGSLTFFIITCALLLPYKPIWIRHLLNFLLYHTFLLFVHYMHENSERRLYILREQLKNQFKATQKAQINERKEADSKRRLTSYVFHEVRVPLNTALLAVQNMAASSAVCKVQEIEFMALEGSLVMMSKVLNDMLDFNRMDSGRFEILSKPYAFHAVVRSLLIPLRMATDARNLELVTSLDETIDKVARQAAYEAVGEDPAGLEKHMDNEEDGVVLGDAIRLRQIINNLASNACKFTPAGGRVTCSTRLLFPTHPAPEPSNIPRPKVDTDEDAIDEVLCAPGDDLDAPSTPKFEITSAGLTKKVPLKRIVVRIEVSDTGHGIPPREMAQGKLFSAFNQTERGRQQGGKGTGLGLALVRQIVKLSGGRLGVRSKVGEGSTFWVELPLGVGVKVVDPPDPESTFRVIQKQQPFELAGPLSVDLLTSRAQTQAVSTNIMQTLMNQGTLVQLDLNAADASESRVLTRAMGELSSSTQLGPPLPTLPTDSSSENMASPRGILRVETYSTESSTTVVADSPGIVDDVNPLPTTSSTSIHPEPPLRKLSLASQTSVPMSRKSSSTPFDPPIIVLVVDDDRLTRTVMSRMLTRLGCIVSTAQNGEVALEKIFGRSPKVEGESNPKDVISSNDNEKDPGAEECEGTTENGCAYDVVFLDNQMPVMSGLEMVSKLREIGRDDFVVGVTGNALIDDQKEYSNAGVDHILTKPVFESSIMKMLTIADERRRKSSTPDEPSLPP